MKWQTNKELGVFINKWGCNFISILEKVEKAGKWKLHFSNELVHDIYKECILKRYISAEVWQGKEPVDGCTILYYQGVYNLAAEKLGVKSKCINVRKEPASYNPKRHEEEILELGRNGYNGSHFVSGTGEKGNPWQTEIEFDPIEGGSTCARLGFIKSKRILEVRKC